MVCRQCYAPSANVYRQYYNDQIGNGLVVYRSSKNYRGSGFGGVLKAIGGIASPFLKKLGRVALKEGLRTGKEIASHVASGHNLKSALKQGVVSGGKRFLNSAITETFGSSSPNGKRARQAATEAGFRGGKTNSRKKRRGKGGRVQGTIFD